MEGSQKVVETDRNEAWRCPMASGTEQGKHWGLEGKIWIKKGPNLLRESKAVRDKQKAVSKGL